MLSYNQDGVYFRITSNDLKSKIDTKDLISLSVTEEQGKLTTGSIVIDDPSAAYFSAIKRGAFMSIEWGYTVEGLIPGAFRKGLSVMVVSPSHSMAENQQTVINFRSGFSMIKERKILNYDDTKRNVVTLVLNQAGLIPIVDFTGSNEKGQFKQDSETDFQFLSRLAREWKKQFLIGYNFAGKPIGVFTDYKSSKNSQYLKQITNNISDNLFEYKAGIRNVIRADIEENFSESGSGDQIRFVIVDGQAVKQQTEATTETVKAFKLDSDALLREQKMIADKKGFKAAQEWTADIVNAQEFESDKIKRFWREVDYKTAAPHSGIKISMETFGNPFYSIPSKARLGAGFPSSVANAKGPAGTAYEIKKVTHRISRDGYKCDVEVRNYLNL